MDNRELFTNKSEDYANYRPSYPSAALKWLRERCTGTSVIDIGAGTGIFTTCLRPYFSGICAVEPNADMRRIFEQNLPEIPCLDGSGENTTLPDHSANLLTVAQAFHWLDEEKFKQEALRILRPGGLVAIIWNNSIPTDFTSDRDKVCQQYCPRFRNGHAGKRSASAGDAFLREVYFKDVEKAEFPNPFKMDQQIFAGNMRSRSYILSPEDKDHDVFWTALNEVFEKHSTNGTVTDFQQTTIYLGHLA